MVRIVIHDEHVEMCPRHWRRLLERTVTRPVQSYTDGHVEPYRTYIVGEAVPRELEAFTPDA